MRHSWGGSFVNPQLVKMREVMLVPRGEMTSFKSAEGLKTSALNTCSLADSGPISMRLNAFSRGAVWS